MNVHQLKLVCRESVSPYMKLLVLCGNAGCLAVRTNKSQFGGREREKGACLAAGFLVDTKFHKFTLGLMLNNFVIT